MSYASHQTDTAEEKARREAQSEFEPLAKKEEEEWVVEKKFGKLDVCAHG